MEDIRILRLFKQHFLDDYPETLKCEYSCWGYYDGISINEVVDKRSSLLQNGTGSPIANIWYNSAELARGLKGTFCEQNIGIFRVKDGLETAFWQAYRTYPYFAVGFLQLNSQATNHGEIVDKIERDHCPFQDQAGELKRFTITYDTFDNADLIVLIQGNSLTDLEEEVRRIEELPDIVYFHAIMGICERYLDDCMKKGTVLDFWNGIACHTDEKLSKITVNLLTSGRKDLEKIVRAEWDFGVNNVNISYVTGHENLILEINGPKVDVLVRLLMPGGFSTHQNKLYRKEIYNITTGIRIKEQGLSLYNPEAVQEKKDSFFEWCQKKIEKYSQQMDEAFRDGDESLYSYYHSILLTFNTLSQFENFALSKNVFYLVCLAFDLFDKQMKEALKKLNEDRSGKTLEHMKDSICEFLDSANSTIYHTIHTDQMFLMIPGYTGTSFSIPIKLCLMYLWFIYEMIDLLNDSQKPFEYQCLLTPEREAKATTKVIGMGLPHGDRLICVKLSQRSLYMPRELLFILSHEIGHYVGDSIRHRKERTHYIIYTAASVVANSILYGGELTVEEESFLRGMPSLEEKLFLHLRRQMEDRLKESRINSEYHDRETRERLETELDIILADCDGAISRIFNEFPGTLLAGKKLDEPDHIAMLKMIFDLQKKLEHNKKEILSKGAARKLIHELSLVYKEVFSDVAAYVVLKFDLTAFQEAFWISEGYRLKGRSANPQQLMREAVIRYLCNPDDYGQIFFGSSPGTGGQASGTKRDIYARVAEEFYYFDVTKRLILEYVKICQSAIEKHVENSGRKQEMERLKELFDLFDGKNKAANQQKNIYEVIKEKNEMFIQRVENKLGQSTP